MTLLDLPRELLINIIDRLESSECVALVQTCRIFNALGTPHLYESATIRDDKIDHFRRTIETQYADLIRHLDVVANTELCISPCRIVPCLKGMHNLQSLSLGGSYWHWDDQWEQWAAHEDGLWNHLEKMGLNHPPESRVSTNLQSLTLDRTEDNGQAAFLHSSCIFIIPTLRHLTLRGFMFEEADGEVKPQYHRQTDLETLRIERSYVEFKGLRAALLTPRALRSLIIQHAHIYWHHEMKNAAQNYATGKDFVEALLPHRDSLEYVKVSMYDEDEPVENITVHPPRLIHPPRRFPVLAHWLGCEESALACWLGGPIQDLDLFDSAE